MHLQDMYDEFFMGNFTKAFREYQNVKDQQQIEKLYRGFMKNQKKSDEKDWVAFEDLCNHLIEMGCFSTIIRFMYGVFLHSKSFDMLGFRKHLLKIEVNDRWNLADLCGDFFLRMQKEELECYELEGDSGELHLDPYEVDLSDYFSLNSYSPSLVVLRLPEFICQQVYDFQLDMEQISKEEIDELVLRLEEEKKEEFEKKNAKIREVNQQRQEKLDELGVQNVLGNLVQYQVKPLDVKGVTAGVLLPVFIASERLNKRDICYYILEQYVVPVWNLVDWSLKQQMQVHLYAVELDTYANLFLALVMASNRHLTDQSSSFSYSQEDFFAELIGRNDGIYIATGKAFCQDYSKLGSKLARVLRQGKEVLKQDMTPDLYSFLMAYIPYLMYCSNQVEEAANFLLGNYEEVNVKDKRNFYVQIVLVRCALGTKNLACANMLYGYYNYEMVRQERLRSSNQQFLLEIIDFLERAKAYIKEADAHTLTTKEAWYDILFANGRIDSIVQNIKDKTTMNAVLTELEYKELMDLVAAFSYHSGVHLGMLNLPQYDDYDKLEHALSEDLVARGEDLKERAKEYWAMYKSSQQLSIHKNVNILLRHRIAKLVDGAVQDSLERVQKLKSAEQRTNETLLCELETVCEDLNDQLQFLENAYSDEKIPDLLFKLPLHLQQEVNRYLVTSELVYQILDRRKNQENLDYSVALIPFMKAFQVILNYMKSKEENMNQLLFDKSEAFLKENYQNIIACKEIVSKAKVKECRDVLLTKEKLFWRQLDLLS